MPATRKIRKADVSRKTGETDIRISLNIDGSGKNNVDTGIGFFDHMLSAFSKHGFFDLDCKVKGDLNVDGHHSVEDTGIVLGTAIKKALGDKAGIYRYGYFILPMDEVLVLCSLDLCDRPFLGFEYEYKVPMIGDLDTELIREFFYAVSYSAGMNLHFKVLSDGNAHHVTEAMFKAFAKALDMATYVDPRVKGVLSTKGAL
ncbi:MAG: imidazoleglycerol-phosphate dehydratase HisB [Lachnospiraceae bacterium]|nr:imidazoleglycerol-phosphate dehydratase HisB [Lachnospiraceae bacterium]MBP5472091.1 imidazoleglycerol-phosphate dehydratase HisB [Lachnospiraceae bacterium]MBP5762714.1 imidazoleglycerol-phosphate dehydratase HisB [Lachnospiraceae bacterium]